MFAIDDGGRHSVYALHTAKALLEWNGMDVLAIETAYGLRASASESNYKFWPWDLLQSSGFADCPFPNPLAGIQAGSSRNV